MNNYWLVGAMWGGNDDQAPVFLRRSYWILGHEDNEQPGMAQLRDKIVSGDRIAIKQMLGRGSPTILIKALGVVREIDPQDKRVYVDWLVKDLKREVESKGCFKAIHGPYNYEDEWTRQVFCI